MLSLIVAISENNAIGKNNKLLCYLPDDLKYFKKMTMNKTIIMGRKTFQSLPGILPNRHHIVISNDLDLNDKVVISNNLHKTLKYYQSIDEEVFIIGGSKIYEQSLEYCNKLYITRILKTFDADVFLDIDYNNYKLESESNIINNNGVNFKFQKYVKL